MSGLPRTLEPNLLVGYDSSDDAAVYRLTDELALIQTVDFFPPVVDDPYDFGQIAAANALSDVYAMGGEPRLAMNLLAVPSCLPREAVDRRKQKRLRAAAACYLSQHDLDAPARFDVAEVYTDGVHRPLRLEYLENAF